MDRRNVIKLLVMAAVTPCQLALTEGKGNALFQCAASGPTKVTDIPVIDTHAHVFKRGLKLAEVRRYAPDYDALPEAYLQKLDTNGMTRGVIIQPSFLGTDNGFLLETLRAHPDRLRGIAVIDPRTPRETLAGYAEAGVVGIRLNLVGARIPDLSMEPWPALLKQLADLDWQVEVYRGALDLPPILRPLLNGGVKVVVDHFGLPDRQLGTDDPGFRYLLSVAPKRRVWVKLSGSYRLGPMGDSISRTAAPLLLDSFGPDRLLWGSDWPHTQFESAVTYSTARSRLDEWVPNEAQRMKILSETAAKLFKFDPLPSKEAYMSPGGSAAC